MLKRDTEYSFIGPGLLQQQFDDFSRYTVTTKVFENKHASQFRIIFRYLDKSPKSGFFATDFCYYDFLG